MFLFALALQESQSGSSMSRIIRSIPHDASAVLIYVLMAVFVGLIIVGSRKRS